MKLDFNYDEQAEALEAFAILDRMRQRNLPVKVSIWDEESITGEVKIGNLKLDVTGSGIIAPYYSIEVNLEEATNRWDNA